MSAEAKIELSELQGYYDYLNTTLWRAEASDTSGAIDQGLAVSLAIDWARKTHAAGRKLIFIGNGGSAAIASHMATDFSKNGNLRSLAMNDGAMLTCLGNDLGYEKVFAKQIDLHAVEGDLLIAISSSGRSANILQGVGMAREKQCRIITMSGFAPDNPLRKMGDINFYLSSSQYGFVEIGHLTICHAILDLARGQFTPGRS